MEFGSSRVDVRGGRGVGGGLWWVEGEGEGICDCVIVWVWFWVWVWLGGGDRCFVYVT